MLANMEQDIRFCTTADGVRIAYAITGSGPPLVRSLGWFTHLEHEWQTPYWRPINEALSEKHTLVRYDGRGMGLSDRDVTDFSLDAKVSDLEAVVEAAGFDRFVIWGLSEGGPTAVTYAVRHPECVKRLVLYGTTPYFLTPDTSESDRQLGETMINLARQGWGNDHPAYRQFFTAMFMPDATGEAGKLFTEFQRMSAPPENVVALLQALFTLDVRSIAPQVTAPTLVIHRRGDTAVAFDRGREFAALIPGARFLPLDGRNHVPMPDEPESAQIMEAVIKFAAEAEETKPSAGAAASGLVTILFTDMEGSTALTQRLGDAQAQDVLRAHNRVVREALKSHGGNEIKHTGDGIMASFPVASGALECAVAIQRNLEAENATSGTPVRVRIGLSAGEPVAEEGDLYGATVQLAARVCAKAEPGQIMVSNVVRELAMGKGFLFADLGEFVPKGFEDPVRIYEVSWA
jgi:class 3 adenylate cyclase